MEWSRAGVWTCLLGAGLVLVLAPTFSMTTSQTGPGPPQLIGCVFLNRANVTCRWEAGDTSATQYTLVVERMPAIAEITNGPLNMFTCTTSGTSCTAITRSSVRFRFCITVIAHSHSGDISSPRRCQSGRAEVMLPPVPLASVSRVRGKPLCLNVTWKHIWAVFPVSDSEIKAGNLKSQIEFTAQGEPDVQVKNVKVTDLSFLVCLFRPDTSYTVRLRHRYLGPESPWSPWSNACRGRTGEDAPSAAPVLWRQVKETDRSGWRLISLLWKPLPHFLANGRVIFFNVTCHLLTKGTQVLNDHGSCRDLHSTSTFCSLRLPAGRCSCALTASTSAGTSPEARIWFLGAFETEPPPPSNFTLSPLSDCSLDVCWIAPGDRPTSGFVVEWSVEEKNSSIPHWKMLNSSCTALVITEGVKPMERYVVSVRALYGELGASQNATVHIYTRQGVPSAGPEVQVQQISGNTVELTWSPVPVELLHGFLRNYTVSYSTANQAAKRVFVPGHARRYSLKNLLPGNYAIFIQANTDTGAGAAGPIANVHIGEGSEEISILTYVLLPLILTSLALVLMGCLARNKMLKEKLCQDVPDPSASSLAHWTPKIALESMKRPAIAEKTDVKYSQIVLLGESELQTSHSATDLTCLPVCNHQTASSHLGSRLPVSEVHTSQSTRDSEKSIKSPTRGLTACNTDHFSCPCIYSTVVFSETVKCPLAALQSHVYLHSNDRQPGTTTVNDVKLQLGGDSELSVSLRSRWDSPLCQTDEQKTLHHFLRQQQSPVFCSDFSSISHPSILPPHPTNVTFPQHPFSQTLYNSFPSLKPDTFTRSDALSDIFTSLSPLPPSVFVDFSYCPVQCEPYISFMPGE